MSSAIVRGFLQVSPDQPANLSTAVGVLDKFDEQIDGVVAHLILLGCTLCHENRLHFAVFKGQPRMFVIRGEAHSQSSPRWSDGTGIEVQSEITSGSRMPVHWVRRSDLLRLVEVLAALVVSHA